MTTTRQITSLLEHALSGKEVAHIVLRCHLDQLLEKQSVFSPGEIERAKRGLESREATIYNNWIDAAHRIECLAMESTITAQGAQKRLLQLLRVLDQYEDNYRMRIARLLSPIVLTPENATQYVEARQQGRRDNMAQHEISLFSATVYRAWELAPEELKGQVRAEPDFEEDENEYEILYRLSEERCRALYEQATQDIANLVEAGKLRFRRNGEDVTSRIVPCWWGTFTTQEEVDSFESKAMCSLLELVDADLPEWTTWAKRNPAELAPAKYRRQVAVLYDPEAIELDALDSDPEDGWNLLERWMKQFEGPDVLSALSVASSKTVWTVRRFVAGREIVRAFSEAIRVDFTSLLGQVEADLSDSIAEFNRHADRRNSTSARPEGLADLPPEIPAELYLERIEVDELGPPAQALAELKVRLGGDLLLNWEEAARELLGSSERVDALTLSEMTSSS